MVIIMASISSVSTILDEKIEASEQEAIETMKKMIAIPSISPLSGGEGESKRADFLESLLKSFGFDVKRYDYNDGSAIRSNLVVKYGSLPATIWLIAHIDTVAPGDLSLWSHDPFDAYIKDGFIYGRGTSDNGQDVIASIYALKALKESGLPLKYNFGLALVADEEVGSIYGIQKLIQEGIFGSNDMFIVPDAGSSSGDEIEIAEKGLLWLKLSTFGKQVHASTPDKGINAYRYAVRFLDRLESFLYEKFNSKDMLFDPPYSTFEITKHEPNVGSTNIIPGTDISYMDCRVLPSYSLDDVLKSIKQIAEEESAAKPGLRIEVEVFNREDPAQPTSKDSEIVKMLSQRVSEKFKINPRIIGIGGGTCALFFRRQGFPVAVWNSAEDTAHQPNEYCKISSIIADAKVFASLFV